MKKTKRALSSFLACLMVLSFLPLGIFGAVATEPATVAEKTWTSEDYDALYVHDADGDDEDDLKFQWDAFDMKEGDKAPVGFVNAVDGAVYKRVDNSDIVATAKNGYLLTSSDLKFSNVFRGFAKNVTYDGASVRVLQDSTWEMVIFQNTDVTYTGTAASPVTQFNAAIAPANKLGFKSYNNGTEGSSFVGATYGVLAPIEGTKNVEIRVDTQADKTFATVFGNLRGADHTFTVAIRHDYTVPEGSIEGSLKLDFLRDGQTQEKASFNVAYDARYKGNYKNTTTPEKSDDMFSFGGMDWGYRAMRIYDVALTEAQLQQNHAVDLFKYYKIDLSSVDFDHKENLKALYASLESIDLGDADASNAVQAKVLEIFPAQAPFDYDALYVHDADGDGKDDLKFQWDAFDMKEGDTAPVGFVNKIDGAVYKRSDNSDIVATAKDGYLLTSSDLKFSNVFRGFAKNVTYEGASVRVLQDSTWEMVIFQNTEAIYEGTKENPPTKFSASIAPANQLNIKVYNDGIAGSSFIGATYGVLAPIEGTDNVQIRVDTQADKSFATVFGNPRGQAHTFTVAIRHDYTIPDGAIQGALKLDFLRDSQTQSKASFTAAYDARYKGNFKNTSSPAKSDDMFTFGGMDWGYRAMRIYDVALTEDQLAQNHAVDLFKYYEIDVTDIDFANKENAPYLKELYVSLMSVNLGDAGAQAKTEASVAESVQKMNMILEGGEEAKAILASDAVLFDGYSIRLLGNPGLRAVFTLDRDFIEAAEANTVAKIKEIGAIVAIKGDYELEDLTVAGGVRMMKKAVYANGEFTKNTKGVEQTYVRTSDGVTCFALTTLFESEETKNSECYKTELLYRGYMIVTVQGAEYIFYTDMTAPLFGVLSMYEATTVYIEKHPEDANTETVKAVLTTCGN